MKWFLKCLLLALVILISSCGNIIKYGNPGNPGGSETIETKVFDPINGKYEFYTNDITSTDTDGASYWYLSQSVYTPLTTWEVRLQKISGQANIGFGLLFNGSNSLAGYKFWMVLINNQGKYSVRKFVNGTETVQKDWTSNPQILSGNSENLVKVTYTPGDTTFRVYFNGSSTPDHSFQDLSAPVLSSGSVGFVAGVGEAEVFPGFPCQVFYEVVNPVGVVF